MMFMYALFIAIASLPFNLAAPSLTGINPRVAGGNLAKLGEFPFLVAPQLNGRQWCAGALLNNYTVLTAAHCSINVPPGNVTVRAGSTCWRSGGTVAHVAEIKIHPSYRAVVGDFDVAIWHLKAPIQPSYTIGYAKLVAQGYEPSAGLRVISAGWGNTAEGQTTEGSEKLRWVNIPTVPREDCSRYGSISNNEICAGGEEGRGSCPNDSGGPIFDAKTNELLGTVHAGGGCGLKGVPIVYTNLGTLGDWVRQNSWLA